MIKRWKTLHNDYCVPPVLLQLGWEMISSLISVGDLPETQTQTQTQNGVWFAIYKPRYTIILLANLSFLSLSYVSRYIVKVGCIRWKKQEQKQKIKRKTTEAGPRLIKYWVFCIRNYRKGSLPPKSIWEQTGATPTWPCDLLGLYLYNFLYISTFSLELQKLKIAWY